VHVVGEGPSHRQDGRQVSPASQWTAEAVAWIVTGFSPFAAVSMAIE
jgi:hypothetical protein